MRSRCEHKVNNKQRHMRPQKEVCVCGGGRRRMRVRKTRMRTHICPTEHRRRDIIGVSGEEGGDIEFLSLQWYGEGKGG